MVKICFLPTRYRPFMQIYICFQMYHSSCLLGVEYSVPPSREHFFQCLYAKTTPYANLSCVRFSLTPSFVSLVITSICLQMDESPLFDLTAGVNNQDELTDYAHILVKKPIQRATVF